MIIFLLPPTRIWRTLTGANQLTFGVGDGSGFVEQRDVREIFGRSGEMIGAACRDRHRVFPQKIVEDREVVDRKVGDHADIALEQAEIHPDRVIVKHAPEFSAPDYFCHLANRTGIDEGMVHQQRPLALLRFVDQFARLKRGLGHRLFEPEMLAGPERRHTKLEMRADRSGHRDGVYRWVRQ